MKIVVIGGTGLIGSKTVAILRQGDHEVVAASPKGGVNTVTGEGLKEASAGAQVAIDLSDAPSRDAKAVLKFFETSSRNLLAAEAAAGVQHHVALSIVGTDRVPDQGYCRAKVAQEKLIEAPVSPTRSSRRSIRKPYHQEEIQKRYIRKAGIAAEIGSDIGWHTFRHSYRSWLDETGAPLTVQKELMRHASIQTTMNVYGKAMTDTKRQAHRRVVELVLKPSKTEETTGQKKPVKVIGS